MKYKHQKTFFVTEYTPEILDAVISLLLNCMYASNRSEDKEDYNFQIEASGPSIKIKYGREYAAKKAKVPKVPKGFKLD